MVVGCVGHKGRCRGALRPRLCDLNSVKHQKGCHVWLHDTSMITECEAAAMIATAIGDLGSQLNGPVGKDEVFFVICVTDGCSIGLCHHMASSLRVVIKEKHNSFST